MRMCQYNYSNSDYLQHYGILGDGAMLDNFYSVNKNTEEVSGFAPWSNPGFIERFSGGD